MRKGITCLGLLLLFYGGIIGCDEVPGTNPLEQTPPYIYDFSFSPHEVRFEDVAVEDTLAAFALTVQARIRPGDVPVDSAFYLVTAVIGTDEPVAQGGLPITNNQISAEISLTLSRGAVGLYTLVVTFVDQTGRLGNQAKGVFRFYAQEGHPPVIEEILMPERVSRPPPGGNPVLIRIVAVVSDPEGLDNIQRVVMRTAGGQEFLLLDDGGVNSNSGDEVAGDGRFTLTVQLVSENAPGVYVFYFQAFDRDGLASEVVEKQLVVE